MLFASAAAGQTQPDFSGRWVLVDPVDATTNIPRTLIVQQPLVRTNVFGAPMPPAEMTELLVRESGLARGGRVTTRA